MDRLKKIREHAGISQAELAEAIGVTQGAISQYETGRWMPTVDKLKAMAQKLGVTVDELLKEDPDDEG